jgi:hypothetical protein
MVTESARSDRLTRGNDRQWLFGEAGLHRALSGCAGRSAPDILACIEEVVRAGTASERYVSL